MDREPLKKWQVKRAHREIAPVRVERGGARDHPPLAELFFDEEWISVVEGLGGRVLFLPPYSPDFNPIEKAFLI